MSKTSPDKKISSGILLAARAAFKEAYAGVSLSHGGPFGAVVTRSGVIIGRGHNTVLKEEDPTCHAEINAIRKASRYLKSHSLKGCALVTTAEPCPMCLAAAYWAGIRNVYYMAGGSAISAIGFSDEKIYSELKKSAKKRSVRCVRVCGLERETKDLIFRWKQKKGKIY
jgi:guanine deaminase